MFLSDFKQIWIFFGQIFIEVHNTKFYRNPSTSGSRTDTCGLTDMKVIVVFRDYAKAPADPSGRAV